jgi:hypothetical protein
MSTEAAAVAVEPKTTLVEGAAAPAASENEYGVPAVPAAYKEMIDSRLARMDKEMNDEAAWQLHAEKHGIKVFTKVDGALTACKGETFMPFHPRAILDIAIDSTNRKEVDSQLAHGGVLKELDAQTVIEYFEYKSMFIVAGRDFCNIAHWRVLPNGTIVIVAKGIEDAELCPLKEPKIVRGDVHLAAWKIVPNAEYTGAQVFYMAKSDLKGSIPSRVAAKAASDQPYILQRITEALKKKNLDAAIAKGKVKNLGA